MKIGLLLGSFDPIHIGHVNVAVSVINDGLVDKVYFVPTPHNPWKTREPVDFNIRCDMIQKTINGSYMLNKMSVVVGFSEEELKEEDRTFYSYDQLGRIATDNNEYYIIAGSDVIPKIKDWYRGDEILKKFKTIEVDRIGNSLGPCIRISSSYIREMIKENKSPIPWVLPEVYRFIKVHNLYTK